MPAGCRAVWGGCLRKARRNGYKNKTLEISLRVLNAYSSHNFPDAADEEYLREVTGDTTTAGDELACELIQAEMRKMRSKTSRLPVCRD
jgi:hypothetical protein